MNKLITGRAGVIWVCCAGVRLQGGTVSPVLTASDLEVTFAWHTFSAGDFALCARGTWDCAVLVLLMFAAFALRSFLHVSFRKTGGCCGAGTNPVAVNLQLPPISGPRCARAVIPLA